MAKKKTAKKEVAAAAPVKGKKKALTAEEKAAKSAERKARMDAIPEGQRQNSKTIDVIETEKGGKVEVYAQPVRKSGVLVTAIAFDAKGNIISVGGSTLVEGYRVKSKKGHGNLALGAPGVGKKSKAVADDTDEDDDDED